MNDIKQLIDKFLKNKINEKNLIELYYNIGSNLKDIDLLELELYLKSIYGLNISFTRRNFIRIKKFYNSLNKNIYDYYTKNSIEYLIEEMKNLQKNHI